MKNLLLDPKFDHLMPFAQNLHQTFKHFGREIHSGRNQLKTFRVEDQEYCVKSFGRPTLVNTVIYSFFRKGKAERSYRYAQKLLKMGINTPQPVGYIEIHNRWKIMTHSYYISLYEPPTYTIAQVIKENRKHKESILQDFASFIATQLHANGIYHKDFNGNNILVYPQTNNHYHFSLVDLNRIRFNQKINFRKALVNIKSVCADPIDLATLSGYYAHERHTDPTQAMFQIITLKYVGSKIRRMKKSFLKKVKSLFDLKVSTTKVRWH